MNGPRILVAEDVVMNQELARELLESAGYAVDIVATGKAAVEAVVAGGYDLVLMDVSMPEMDGMTATRLIRQGPVETSGIPIIACTAHVLPEQVEAMKEAGFDLYLFKPLQREELFGVLARVLGSAGDQTADAADEGMSGGVASLVDLLGPAAVLSALGAFVGDLKALEADDALARGDRGRLAARAHAAIATASLLDLTDLAAACRDLENACRLNEGIDEVIERLKMLVHSALREVDGMRNRLEAQREPGNTYISTKTQ